MLFVGRCSMLFVLKYGVVAVCVARRLSIIVGWLSLIVDYCSLFVARCAMRVVR